MTKKRVKIRPEKKWNVTSYFKPRNIFPQDMAAQEKRKPSEEAFRY